MAPDSKPLNYVMVLHLGYARDFHVHRAVRSGGRRQRFTLDNGRQIRAKGSRYTEVSFDEVFKNFNTLLQGIREGRISVCRPDNLEPFTMEQFVDLGNRLAADFKNDLEINETLLEPLVGSNLTDKQVWVEKPTSKVEEAPKPVTKPAATPAAPPKAEELPKEPVEESAELTEEQLMEMSLKDLQKIAKDYGVKHLDKFHKKQDLVDAIIDAASKE